MKRQLDAFSSPAQSPPKKDLCLLVLDGGGVRGLSMLLIIKRLMEGINPLSPPKPCDYFDMIGGTSTGGLIALMLGRMKLGIDACIEAYSNLSPRIFSQVRHRIKLSTGKTQGRFDHVAMEQGIKDVLMQYGMDPETLFKSSIMEDCKTFVCVTSQATGQTVVLSNYYNERRGTDLLNTAKIWEAARATSAATTFFEPITISDETFVDGATGANNPINQIWSEAADLWGLNAAQLEENVKCLVSIGTGIPSLSAFGLGLRELAKALKAIATETEATADMFRRQHTGLFQSGKAFRFNVVRGLEGIGLDETLKLGVITAATRNYVQKEEIRVEIKKCVANLLEREWLERMEKFIIGTIEVQVSDLNDDDSLESADQLQWLMHTMPYDTWHQRGFGIIWYQLNARQVQPDRRYAGASVAHCLADRYKCSAGLKFGAGDNLARALYFQCDQTEQPGIQANDETGSGQQDILWSLICQLLMIDCKDTAALKNRLAQLEAKHKSFLWEKLDGYETQSIAQWSLFEELLLLLNAPDVIALDNVHNIHSSARNEFLKALATLAERLLATRGLKLRVMISGDPSQIELDMEGEILTVNDRTEREECLRSLYFPEWNVRRDQVADADAGTNAWIWTHEQYLKWEQATSGLLWVEGKPGSGKSVLAKTLQKQLKGASMAEGTGSPSNGSFGHQTVIRSKFPEIPMVTDWFFNSRGGEIGIAYSSFLQSIVYQLLQQNEAAFDVITPFYRNQTISRQQTWDAERIQSVLGAISATGLSIICIIDAIDEAAGVIDTSKAHHTYRARSLLSLLGNLLSKIGDTKLKLIVLSRPDPAIEMDFSGIRRRCSNAYKVVLEHENQLDVQLVVEKGLRLLQETIHAYDSDDELQDGRKESRSSLTAKREENAFQNIRIYLTENAKGVILWATLILGELHDQAAGGMLKFATLEVTMKRLPLRLDKFYEYIVRELEERLSDEEIKIVRLAMILISGSAALDRPMNLQEMWEALAVPADVEPALSSKVDPIIENSIHIISWKEFWRQLRRKCGPLIELVRGEELEPGQRLDAQISPTLVVQFMHRTVKDFLNHPDRVGPLHFSEKSAVDEVKSICARYLEIAFPQSETAYGPPIPARDGSSWKRNIQKYVDYLDSRSLLQFVLNTMAPNGAKCQPNLGVYASIDKMIHLPWPKSQWRYIEDSDVTRLIGRRYLFYPKLLSHTKYDRAEIIKAAVLGQAFRYACTSGRMIAVRNMLELGRNYHPTFSELEEYVIGNGVLLACIEKGLLDEVKFLTKNHRHQSRYIHGTSNMPGWPTNPHTRENKLDEFIQLAVRSGQEEIVEFLFLHTDQYYTRKKAVADFAVTRERIASHRHTDLESDDDIDELDSAVLQSHFFNFDMKLHVKDESDVEENNGPIHKQLRPSKIDVSLLQRGVKISPQNENNSGYYSVRAKPPGLGYSARTGYIEVMSDRITSKREAKINKIQYLRLKESCLKMARENRMARADDATDESCLQDVQIAVSMVIPWMPTEDGQGYGEGQIQQNALNPFLQLYAMTDLPRLSSEYSVSTRSPSPDELWQPRQPAQQSSSLPNLIDQDKNVQSSPGQPAQRSSSLSGLIDQDKKVQSSVLAKMLLSVMTGGGVRPRKVGMWK
ncbi:uncharacterized protein N7479_003866 [Penicillium vulpinum]|uniref:PNPLA domain-containing protein n=1 Tax=Penicillium vulpinum TaxID=29845 RepID=A0A1V6RH64_9EURO|nr:uncharacterized protein N7479_003866 [Penicillium vulpinum]KAJ5963990.1 hypothetical protein N7479_003866 [Penicillium vulpinum]OQE00838.1 hypothetical protein PENVUL_c045G02326 [Penicillium vulpinum]